MQVWPDGYLGSTGVSVTAWTDENWRAIGETMNASELSDREFVESLADDDSGLNDSKRLRLIAWGKEPRRPITWKRLALLRLDLAAALQRAETAELCAAPLYSDRIANLEAKLEAAERALEEARKDTERLETVCSVINNITGDDFCEDLDMQPVDDGLASIPDLKTAHEKLSAIYRAAHSAVKIHTCFAVHDDWRKEVVDLDAALNPTKEPHA